MLRREPVQQDQGVFLQFNILAGVGMSFAVVPVSVTATPERQQQADLGRKLHGSERINNRRPTGRSGELLADITNHSEHHTHSDVSSRMSRLARAPAAAIC